TTRCRSSPGTGSSAASTPDWIESAADEPVKFEIQQSLTADTADFLHVFHARNPGDQRAEDDQRDDHGDQANKGVAEGLHCDSLCGADITEEDGHSDAEQYLER